MDTSLVLTGCVSLWLGWCARGWFPEPQEVPPCACNCNCYHQAPVETAQNWPHWAVYLAVIVGGIGLLADAALAFKVTVVSKGDSTSREVAFSVKGKSKGIYNPGTPLRITG